MLIRKLFGFEAAHVLPHHAGKCSRPHGHSYRLEVALAGELQAGGQAVGMVEDFDVLAAIVQRTVVERLDHRSLNEIIENPTAELIALWIWRQLAPELGGLEEIVLWETTTACAIVRKHDVAAG